LKILHISYIYPPKLEVADGITTVVYNVTKELAKRGHKVAVCTSNMLDLNSNNSVCSGHKMINGVDVYYLKSVMRFKTFIATPNAIPLLLKKFSNYDVIHIHDCRSFQGISSFLFSKMKNIPYVFQPHGSYLASSSVSTNNMLAKGILDSLICNRIVQNASKIIALNSVEAEQYKTFGLPNEKISIIPNGIDLSQYSNLPHKGTFRIKFNIKTKVQIALYLGRIHKTKGLEVLIKAYAFMLNNFSIQNTLLVVAGPDDGFLNEAKSLVVSLGISGSVLFTGFIDPKDKMAALVDSDLFVTPAFSGFPMTFLEACIVGTPILTTTMGDKLDWINDKVGYITSPQEADLASAMNKMFHNESKRKEFSKNSVELVKTRFSLDSTVDKLEEVYKSSMI
jgi:glycosyltransferase involved in cell wall biosynthesis